MIRTMPPLNKRQLINIRRGWSRGIAAGVIPALRARRSRRRWATLGEDGVAISRVSGANGSRNGEDRSRVTGRASGGGLLPDTGSTCGLRRSPRRGDEYDMPSIVARLGTGLSRNSGF